MRPDRKYYVREDLNVWQEPVHVGIDNPDFAGIPETDWKRNLDLDEPFVNRAIQETKDIK